MRSCELEHKLSEADTKIASLEKSVEQSRVARQAEGEDKEHVRIVEKIVEVVVEKVVEKVVEVPMQGGGDLDKMSKQIAELKQQLKNTDEERSMLANKLARERKDTTAKNDELAKLKFKIKELESLQNERGTLDRSNQNGKLEPDQEMHTELPVEVKIGQNVLEEQQGKSELEKDLASTRKELENYQKEHRDALQHICELEEQLRVSKMQHKPVGLDPPQPSQEAPSRNSLNKDQLKELEELRQKALDLEKTKGKLAKRDAEIAALREEKDQFEQQQNQMLKTLHALRVQLKKVKEIAEKKGYGSVVAEILDEAGITSTLNSPEYSCFNRLYEDALRRMVRRRTTDQTGHEHGSNLSRRSMVLPSRVAWETAHMHTDMSVAPTGVVPWNGASNCGSQGAFGANIAPSTTGGTSSYMTGHSNDHVALHELGQQDKNNSIKDATPLDLSVRRITPSGRGGSILQLEGLQRPFSANRSSNVHHPHDLQRPGTATKSSSMRQPERSQLPGTAIKNNKNDSLMLHGHPMQQSSPSVMAPCFDAATVSVLGTKYANDRANGQAGSCSTGSLGEFKLAKARKTQHGLRGGGWGRVSTRRYMN